MDADAIIAEIRSSCAALFPAGQVVELRVLGIPGSRGFKYKSAGWFNDPEALAREAAKYDSKNPEGVYVTINPVHEACLARTSNEMQDRMEIATTDRDILRRYWLPIDIDPVRPAGVSASLRELEMANEKAAEVQKWLENEIGFPAGLRAASGNGVHLLYRIAMDNTPESLALLKACMSALAERFNTLEVKLDDITNASRILKLWGTVARKGKHVEDRPHRRSKLLTPRIFDEIGIVTVHQLQTLAGHAPKTPTTAAVGTTSKQRTAAKESPKKTRTVKPSTTISADRNYDLEAWFARNGVEVTQRKPTGDGGIIYILDQCLFDQSHVGSSAAIGRTPGGVLYYRCHHDSCKQKQWHDARDMFKHTEPVADSNGEDSWSIANRFIDDNYTDPDLGCINLRRHRQQFYGYSIGTNAYKPISDDSMNVEITRWLGDNQMKTGRSKIGDILNCIESVVNLPEEIPMPFVAKISTETRSVSGSPEVRNWTTLENGILDVDGFIAGRPIRDCLISHTADWFSTTSLDFAFPLNEADADCSQWIEFLHQIFEGDTERVAVIQEMFGYCFMLTSELEKFFILHGRGNNGKSTILNVLTLLLGKENTASLTLKQLDDRTMPTAIYGKLANICADLPEMNKVEEGVIKRITSGEAITCDRKYKTSLEFNPMCKLIFGTNTLPRFTDTSMGIWRRMILIPFEYVVPNDQIDPSFRTSEKFREELPGIFLWALRGARRVASNREFTRSEVCERANRDYKMDCFPVYTFVNECLEPSGECVVSDVWATYESWCKAYGLKKLKPMHTFVRDLATFCPQISLPKNKKRLMGREVLSGISIARHVDFSPAAQTESLDRMYSE